MVKYLTIKDYANATGMTESGVRELVRTDKLKHQKVGTKAYIAIEEDSVSDELVKKIDVLEKMIFEMCKHFGVNVDSLLQE